MHALKRMPGVASVSRSVGMGVGTTAAEFKGVEARDDGHFTYRLLLGTFDKKAFSQGEVLVGSALARDLRIRPESRLRIPVRDGFADLRVQGVWANGDYNGREITMPMRLLEGLYGPQPAVSLTVQPAPGVSPDDLARRIERAHIDPFLTVHTPDDQFHIAARESAVIVQPFWAIQRGLMLVAFAAVLFTLLLVAVQRRRELGMVAAVGMPPDGLARTVLTEALAVGIVSTIVGTLAGLGFTELFRQVSFVLIPFDFPFRADLIAPLRYGALTTVLLLVAAAWPAWRASHLSVVEAIRYE
jgi:putative ABC transport system permease protein